VGELRVLLEQPPLDLGQDALLMIGQRHVRLRPGRTVVAQRVYPGTTPSTTAGNAKIRALSAR
jgi:hypothetical protein